MNAPTERGLSGKVSGLDREPTAGELGIADGPSEEYRSGPLDLLDLPDLPVTLASVDDVRRVCEAAGLTEGSDQEWGSGDVAVYTGLRRGANLRSVVVELVRPDDTHRSGAVVQWSARFYPGAPAHLLAAAIQAARSAS